MKSNSIPYPYAWLCMVLLFLATSCKNGRSSKHSKMLDCSLVIVEDNYPEGYKQQTANAMPRSILFVYKIKNNSSKPAYLPLHSDNVTDRKKPSELSLFIDAFRIGAKTKVRNFQSEEGETYIYDLSFNEYGYVVENRKKVCPYSYEEGMLYSGDSIFVSIMVKDSLLKKAGLPSDIDIYDLMDRMQVKYIPDLEYDKSYMIADLRQCASRYISFCFRMEVPEKKEDSTSELFWNCDDDENDEERRNHLFFSGMSYYY